MNRDKSYIRGKLRETIYSLATGPGDVRKRLIQAHKGFFYLKKENFPKELQPKWEWVIKELTKFGPNIREDGTIFMGSVENTCNRIKIKTGVKIAKKILEIYLSMKD